MEQLFLVLYYFTAACRGKKSPLPGMVTNKPYHTLVGDPDVSWYLGLDPDVKLEDVDQTGDSKVSTVEVCNYKIHKLKNWNIDEAILSNNS